jgi:acetyl esterase/lipase
VSASGYAVDAELAPVLAELAERARGEPAVARGDWRALRENAEANMRYLAELEREQLPDVELRDFTTLSADGPRIDLRWYAKLGSAPGSAVVFAHGGGMIAGNIDMYDPMVTRYVNDTGMPFLSVGYRLAPEATGTTPADDVFAGLRWLIDHASELGVDPGRVAVMGESAGGGIAAGVAIRARDEGIELARQVLIYPMLDDRNVTSDGLRDELLTWDYDMSFTCWTALLGDRRGTESVSAVAAPARLGEFRGLAPAYLEVGDLDIFRDEDLAYAARLAAAGVAVEFHLHPGAPHGYERYAPESAVARRAMYDRARSLRSV